MGRKRKKHEGSWRDKLYPIFFELAELNSQFEERWAKLQANCKQELDNAGATMSSEVRHNITSRLETGKAELDSWLEGRLVEINTRYKPITYNPLAYSYFTLDQPVSDAEGIREYLHFHRHGESLEVSKTKDVQGDLDAFDRISRTERDVRKIAFAKGPIEPFQEDTVHRQLLQLLICYERERLSSNELAECFDKYCSCNRDIHDADSLRKMRVRFERELKAALISGRD